MTEKGSNALDADLVLPVAVAMMVLPPTYNAGYLQCC